MKGIEKLNNNINTFQQKFFIYIFYIKGVWIMISMYQNIIYIEEGGKCSNTLAGKSSNTSKCIKNEWE